jgi:RNA ligase (TIGR02306 family)
MSSFGVKITKIKAIEQHENATALEIARVYDWTVVVRKGEFKPGDRVVYIPVDSILPTELENKIFPIGSKIKLRNSRVRSIKLRGAMSQGMIIDPTAPDLDLPKMNLEDYLEVDISDKLGIIKYEPPVNDLPWHMKVKSKKKGNPEFKKYTDIENFKYYDRLFQDYEPVYVSEKLHGTSFRAGWFPMKADTIWKRIKDYFGFLPKWEFCWGSRTVQIQVKGTHQGFHDETQGVNFDDVYTKMVAQYDLKNRIPIGYAIYGEIVGDGIQKGYTYDCGPGEHKLYLYDVMNTTTGYYLDYYKDGYEGQEITEDMFPVMCYAMGLERVPELYVGPFNANIINKLRCGPSTFKSQPVSEGIVIKPMVEKVCSIGRKVLKYINDDYYLQKDGSDFH